MIRAEHAPGPGPVPQAMPSHGPPESGGTTPIGDVQWRRRVRVAGQGPLGEGPDPYGHRQPGVHARRRDGVDPARVPGTQAGSRPPSGGHGWSPRAWSGRGWADPAMLNPDYELLAGVEVARACTASPP